MSIFLIFIAKPFFINTGIVCPHLDHPQYGRVKVDSYSPSSRAHYNCDDGYILYGLTYRKCLADGSWYGKAPICRKSKSCIFVSIFLIFIAKPFFINTGIVCPHLDHPQYGRVKVDRYSPSSRAYYSCDDGYILHGLTYRKCLADGSWYGKAPICRKSKSHILVSSDLHDWISLIYIEIICPHLDHPQYGRVKVATYHPSSQAFYSCDNGYDLHGLSSRKCLPDGSWYGKAPICRKSKSHVCEYLLNFHN